MRKVMYVLAASVSIMTAASAQAQGISQAGKVTASPVDAELIARAQMNGQMAASNVGTGGWFGSGFAGGVLVGLIGTGVTYAFASNSNVELPADRRLLISSEPADYQHLYEKAYADKVKSKRKSSSLKGGLLGTATLVLLVLSSSSATQ